MTDDAPENESEVVYAESRKEARRAQWALNSLVVLSALAGAAFFAYVIYTVNIFGRGKSDPIEIPTSAPGASLGMLTGEAEGLSVTLRDIDEAPTYREQLSEVMRQDLAIETPGRMYLLIVRNDSGATRRFNPDNFTLRGKDGSWDARWLSDVADAGQAGAVGRMRIAQSVHSFELEAGESRSLYVFVASKGGLPPSAEDLVTGALKLADGKTVSLTHTDVKVAER